MSNKINFKGLDHYPKEEAIISDLGSSLKVSNFTTSGLDGIAINTNKASEWEMTFKDLTFKADTVLNYSINSINKKNVLRTVSQLSIFPCSDGKNAYLALNGLLEGETITVICMKNGVEVARQEYKNPNNGPSTRAVVTLFVGIVVVASLIASNIDYKKISSETTDADGNVSTTVTKEISFGGGGLISFKSTLDPENPDFGDKDIDFDHIYIESALTHAKNVKMDEIGEIAQVEITASGIDELEITDYTFK